MQNKHADITRENDVKQIESKHKLKYKDEFTNIPIDTFSHPETNQRPQWEVEE
jgi:hypothetical protein